MQRVTVRNATFQQWQTLLTNRNKRHRAGATVVQGVRPITLAVEAGLPVRAWLIDGEGSLSSWASELTSRVRAERFAVAPELLRELGGKDDDTPELLAVVGLPSDDLDGIASRAGDDALLAVALDRPTSPGNVGTVVRSVDAFGGHGVIVTGHAADPYDPKAVRASTGSVFAVPVVGAASAAAVTDRIDALGDGVQVVGTDEDGDVDLRDVDLTMPTLVVTGNETRGLSAPWREACDVVARIPMRASAASSLNMATATSVVLYEALRQRGV
ncbi:TrmH family RNA methyltransferase [Luteimicrobium subarcticum]|uniref:TrmH family RNA methyltransferase n=1 Tax=Luteimicrobium subarcticum TaxID=620910 RepID=A0A2M8WUQ9_9MICO|nr:TrmH family RNA methyltransferase [Luteimicrobium subarcticum]PJI94670.1 TrmH family RNA methyltransferase [Luteimicrobium subarcticum]